MFDIANNNVILCLSNDVLILLEYTYTDFFQNHRKLAVKNETLYIIEVNPRASRTVPFVSKTTGHSWANYATKVILGQKISDLN